MRILLVEDNDLLGDAIHDHVVAAGYAVDWVADLETGIQAADGARYDLVLLDLRLPDGSGLSLIRRLRQGVRRVPVMVLSSYDQLSDRIEALEVGSVDYLIKPFDLSELLYRIRQAVIPAGDAGPVLPAPRSSSTFSAAHTCVMPFLVPEL